MTWIQISSIQASKHYYVYIYHREIEINHIRASKHSIVINEMSMSSRAIGVTIRSIDVMRKNWILRTKLGFIEYHTKYIYPEIPSNVHQWILKKTGTI